MWKIFLSPLIISLLDRYQYFAMNILEDLLSTLNFDATIRDIREGVFHTAVLTRDCGLAATLPRDALKQKPPLVKEPGHLLSKSPRQLAQLVFSESILEAAMGMATINSLLDVNEERCHELNARDLIADKGANKHIAIVGHFPFIKQLQGISKKLWVIEKNPQEGDFPEHDAEKLIPKADVVGITGTAFTNHTINQLLDFCDPKAYVVVLGDSAPLSPMLLDYGIDAVSGTKVTDSDLVLRCVSQGANFRQIKGTRRLTMMKE